MAITPKEPTPFDRYVASFLAQAVEEARLSRRDLADATGLGLNRLGTILRGETPPPSLGEVGLIASAAGQTLTAAIADAEKQMEQYDDWQGLDLAARKGRTLSERRSGRRQ